MRDLGSLRNCLVESEEGAGLRSPRRRRISLLLATALQCVVLGALILVPLIVSGERLQNTRSGPPQPIYVAQDPGPPPDSHPVSGPTKRGPRPPVGTPQIFTPRSMPDRAAILHDAGEQVPDVGPSGPGIIGAIPIPGWDSSRSWRPPVPEPPKPTTNERRKVAVSEGVQAARLIHRVEPRYPPLAIQTRTEGKVVLRALIGTDGTMREVRVVSGHPLLVLAAQDAVMQWRYQPTLLNGQPVEVETQITVIFTLQR